MIEETIRTKLEAGFRYDLLDVINESHLHSVPKNSETHFRVLVVSADFERMPRLARHRKIHSLLQQELDNGVHALAIDACTPSEWVARNQEASRSPKCLGGSKR